MGSVLYAVAGVKEPQGEPESRREPPGLEI